MQRVLFSLMNPARRKGPTPLYTKIKHHMAASKVSGAYAFVGHPFSHLPHPAHALRGAQTATQLLESYWDELLTFMGTVVQPHLDEGRNVVCDGFGLDAFLTVAIMAPEREYESLVELHHGLVQKHLRSRGITPPTYMLMKMDPEFEIAWLITNHGFDEKRSDEYTYFIRRRDEVIKHYFSDDFGQLPPFGLKFSDSDEEQCRRAYTILTGSPMPVRMAA